MSDSALISSGRVSDPYFPTNSHPKPGNMTSGGAPEGAGFVIEGTGEPSGAPSTINESYDDTIPWHYKDLDGGGTYSWDVTNQAWI